MESQANERKEEEIEKEAGRISEKRKSCSKATGSHNQKSEWDCTGLDKLLQNRDDEAEHGRTGRVAETQNSGNRHEAVEETENHLSQSKLSEQETPKWN